MTYEIINNSLLKAFGFHLKNEFQSALDLYSSILKIEYLKISMPIIFWGFY